MFRRGRGLAIAGGATLLRLLQLGESLRRGNQEQRMRVVGYFGLHDGEGFLEFLDPLGHPHHVLFEVRYFGNGGAGEARASAERGCEPQRRGRDTVIWLSASLQRRSGIILPLEWRRGTTDHLGTGWRPPACDNSSRETRDRT